MASGQKTALDAQQTYPNRFRGHRGGVIRMHRALAQFRLGRMNLATAISLFMLCSMIWIAALPLVVRFWTRVLTLGLQYLPLAARLEIIEHHYKFLTLKIPCLRMEPVLPSLKIWGLSCVAAVLLLVVTFRLPKHLTPVIYLLRAILLVHGSALFYFAIWPSRFPHTPDSYMEALLLSGIGIISVVPLLFGLTYYIFDFGLLRKASLTFLTMAYLSVFVPFQFLLQALVLQKTILFMPLLYIIFGMPLDVLLIIAFYSWGMTWPLRTSQP